MKPKFLMNSKKFIYGLSFFLASAVVSIFFVNCGSFTVRSPSSSASQNLFSSKSPDSLDINVMWYDADMHPDDIGSRPDQGWHRMNPQNPGPVQVDGIFRTATPLLGTYSLRDEAVLIQHARWLKALKMDAVVIDWTNAFCDFQPYYSRVKENAENIMRVWSAHGGPAVIFAVRISNEDYNRTKCVTNDIYDMYNRYPQMKVQFADGSPYSEINPLIFVFTDFTPKWIQEGPQWGPGGFNTRWMNGYLLNRGLSHHHSENKHLVNKNFPYWEFVESYSERTGDYHHLSRLDGSGVYEQGTAWVAKHLGGNSWDKIWDRIDGLTPFERDLRSFGSWRPRLMILQRWNYAIAWKNEPQEGLSLETSNMIEPSQELGFSLFYHVQRAFFRFRSYPGFAPPAPQIQVVNGKLRITQPADVNYLAMEYTITNVGEQDQWKMVPAQSSFDVSIPLKDANIKLRNAFGESPVIHFSSGKLSSPPPVPVDTAITITNSFSGDCLDADANSLNRNGTTLQTWSCSGALNQKWFLRSVGQGRYNVVSAASGRCLDVESASSANLAKMQLWDCNGNAQQSFYIESNRETQVRPLTSPGSCLNIRADINSGLDDGTPVMQWTCEGSQWMKWNLNL